MLLVAITRNNTEFTITGHAMFDEHGKDIVCSAVSFYAQSTATQLKHYVHTSEKIMEGYMEVKLITYNHESDVLMRAFRESMFELSQIYPENVKFVEK